MAGVPPILARCISARTPHRARCVWATRDYGNGVLFDGDVEWRSARAEAVRLLQEADAVIVHNGRVAPEHEALIASKPVVTMAHNYLWNVDAQFVSRGLPGVVVGQYQATLPEFAGWTVVPNPVPLWEPAYSPEPKPPTITVAYTPSGRHERYPTGHRLYWHGKGYDTTMRVLDRLSASHGIAVEVIRHGQISHAESLAMKRRAHIVIDECVTGSYHRNTLEGLAAGCVVINGVGLLPGVIDVFRRCAGGATEQPCVFSALEDLGTTLRGLIATGAISLESAGRANRQWMESHWDFAQQWERFWQPAIEAAVDHRRSHDRRPSGAPAASPRGRYDGRASIVVPHGGASRLPQLAATLAALRRQNGEHEIIVAELGAEPWARDIASRCADKYVFSHRSGAFERARALNIGSALADAEFVLWHDNDLVSGPDFVSRAIAEFCERRLDYLIPYTSVAYLSQADTADVLAGRRMLHECLAVNVHSSRRSRRCSGGLGLVRRQFLRRHGGLIEGFEGWGGEDNAWNVKVRLLGRLGPTNRSDQPVHHLFHESSAGNPGDHPATLNPRYAGNLELLQRVQKMQTAAQFLRAFPPGAHQTCAWDPRKSILVVDSGEAEAAARVRDIAEGLRVLFGASIGVQPPGCEPAWHSTGATADAMVFVGSRPPDCREPNRQDDPRERRTVVVDPVTCPPGDAAATSVTGPLSLILADTAPSVVWNVPRTDDSRSILEP